MSRLLDLFCGAGGAAMGYSQAGFTEIVGVDIEPQPNYPFEFYQHDVRWGIKGIVEAVGPTLIHASPPCQAYSNAQRLRGNDHPDLIGLIRQLLIDTGKPYVIENVPGAPLWSAIELCGAMFDLGTYRHRRFERAGFALMPPPHPHHEKPVTKMGRPPRDGEMMHVVGNFSGVARARKAMGIDWMTRDELREAIPPAYSEWIGEQFLAQIASRSTPT